MRRPFELEEMALKDAVASSAGEDSLVDLVDMLFHGSFGLEEKALTASASCDVPGEDGFAYLV